jgi:hypothetical protein
LLLRPITDDPPHIGWLMNDIEAAMRAFSEVGGSSIVSIFRVVVLPAPQVRASRKLRLASPKP